MWEGLKSSGSPEASRAHRRVRYSTVEFVDMTNDQLQQKEGERTRIYEEFGPIGWDALRKGCSIRWCALEGHRDTGGVLTPVDCRRCREGEKGQGQCCESEGLHVDSKKCCEV